MPDNPLSSEEAKIVNQTARTLRILISNSQLYSPKSQLVKDGITGLIKTLDPYLSAKGKMTLSESEKNLIVDGQVLKTADKSGVAFVENMIQCELRSITIKNGITEEELLVLVENMSIKKKELRPEIDKLLSEKGYTHIEVNQKVYVALNDDQEIRQESGNKDIQPLNETGGAAGVSSGGSSGGTASGNFSGGLQATQAASGMSAVEIITTQAEQVVSIQKKERRKRMYIGSLRICWKRRRTEVQWKVIIKKRYR